MSHHLAIGIVACSAEGAALCYRTICHRASTVLGPHAHPDIALHGASLADYVTHLDAGNLEGVAGLMLRSAQKLEAAGANFLICPDNTIHAAMPLVRPRSPLPWLHIAEVVAAEARRRGFGKVGILGTHWLVESSVYPEALGAAKVGWMRPEPADRDRLGRIIMDELVNDEQRPDSVVALLAIIDRMKARGCDAVVLGCTELPIVLNDANSALPTLDSTRLLAAAALAHSMSASKPEAGR